MLEALFWLGFSGCCFLLYAYYRRLSTRIFPRTSETYEATKRTAGVVGLASFAWAVVTFLRTLV